MAELEEPTVRIEPVAGCCVACGEPVAPGGRFCSTCGTSIAAAFPAPPREHFEPLTVLPSQHPVPHPKRRWRMAIGAGMVAVAVLGLALAFVLSRPKEPTYDLESSLSAADRALDDLANDLARVQSLASLRELANGVIPQVTRTERVMDELTAVSDVETRAAAVDVFAAQKRVLVAVSQYEDITPETISRRSEISDGVHDGVKELEDAVRRLPAVALTTPTISTVGNLERAIVHAAHVAEGAEVKLSSWRAEVERINSDKNMRRGALASYGDAVRAELRRYTELRNELQAFSTRLEDPNAFVTYDEAYATLADASAGRRSVRDALAGLRPPASATAAHQGLIDTINVAIAAVQQAVDGVRQDQRGGFYTYYRDTPGWEGFVSRSSDITRSYASAVAAWEKQIAAETGVIDAIATPSAPSV